jgi:TetR/AcrR family transcriptional regulator, mexJK operon transcriptional repressor
MLTRLPPRIKTQPRRPRGRPKAQDLEALETRLVLVARQAFALNGYGATSINSIARSARVSKNTLYARFPSKAALFRAIVAGQIASVDQELPPAFEVDDEPLEEKLRAYFNIALKKSLSGDILQINRLIASESYQFPELAEAAQARFGVGVQHVAELIAQCAQRDRIPCRSPAAAAQLFLLVMYGWYTSIMTANRVVSDRERVTWVNNAISVLMASRTGW